MQVHPFGSGWHHLQQRKNKNADSVNTTSGNTGRGKDVVLCSAPPTGCRDIRSVVGILLRLRQVQWERCNAEGVQADCFVDLTIGLHRVTVLVE